MLFEWRSLDHVDARRDARAASGAPLDYFHINSIDIDADGDLLVSARNTWAVYKIDRGPATIVWRLGGKRSDFALGPGRAVRLAARRAPPRTARITIFDNGATPQVEPQSRAIVVAARQEARCARRSCAGRTPHRRLAVARSSGRAEQPNGNVFVGWGTEPYFTEYGPTAASASTRASRTAARTTGRSGCRGSGARAAPGGRYRNAHGRARSTCRGTAPPRSRVAARPGPRPGALAPAAPSRAGLRDRAPHDAGRQYAPAVALDACGHVLGRSKTLRI